MFDQAFNIADAKEKTAAGNLDGRQKQERYKQFKACTINSFLCFLVGVRIANLVSVITITQTGRYYYRNSMGLKKGKQIVQAEDPGLLSTFAQMSGMQSAEQDETDRRYDELLYQLNMPAIEKQRQLLPKDDEQMRFQMQICERFTREVYKRVLMPFITEQLVPLIKQTVHRYIDPLRMNKEASGEQVTILLRQCFNKVMLKLFEVDS